MSDLATDLQAATRTALRAAANPAKAPDMQAYMKSDMPFLGVQMPARRALIRALAARYAIDDRATWERAVRLLWDDAVYREERYVAIALTGQRRTLEWQDLAALPLYEHLIVTGAWWDYVDEVAIRRIGPILRAYPRDVAAMLRGWAIDADLWRRRTAVIAQIGAKSATDTRLLADAIEANLDGPPVTRNFFIRKGIGWALREYAKTDATWVCDFVTSHTDRLSSLSMREATKHLPA